MTVWPGIHQYDIFEKAKIKEEKSYQLRSLDKREEFKLGYEEMTGIERYFDYDACVIFMHIFQNP